DVRNGDRPSQYVLGRVCHAYMHKLAGGFHAGSDGAFQHHFIYVICNLVLAFNVHQTFHSVTYIFFLLNVMLSITSTSVRAASMDGRHGMPLCTDTLLMRKPSRSTCLPFVIALTTICTLPLCIARSRLVCPAPTLSTAMKGMPCSCRTLPVPSAAIRR